jgi:hypothetical protein
MGDRCSIDIQCHRNTLPLFEEAFGGMNVTDDNDKNTIEGWFDEVNYAGAGELEIIAQKGVPFIGKNGSGDDYGPGRFCSVDGKYMEIETDMDGEPIVKTKNGKIDKSSSKYVKAYMEHEKKAEAALLQPYILNGVCEVKILVTLQVDPDDVNKTFPMKDLQNTAKEAIENALNLVENAGFSHTLANEVSIGVQSVEIVEESK